MEQTRLWSQHQAWLETKQANQLDLDGRTAQINERITNLENLKNQSQPDGSPLPGLTDIERQIEADYEVILEEGKRISDEIHAYNAEIDKWLLDSAKLSVRKLEKEISERNSR